MNKIRPQSYEVAKWLLLSALAALGTSLYLNADWLKVSASYFAVYNLVALISVYPYIFSGGRLKDYFRAQLSYSDWAYILKNGALSLFATTGLTLLSLSVGSLLFMEAALESVLEANNEPSLPYSRYFLAIVIIAPVIEELCFRGWNLIRTLDPRTAKQKIIFSSVVFGLAHPLGALGAYLHGFLFALYAFRFRSLKPSVAIHALNNLLIWILLLLIEKAGGGDSNPKISVSEAQEFLRIFQQFSLLFVVMILIGLPSVIRIFRDCWPRQSPTIDPPQTA